MQVDNRQNFVITQTLVDLQEKKIDKNKPKQFIEFLRAITVSQIQFDSPDCYSKFLQILKKASLTDSALYESTIRFFKNSLGLPENVFEEKVSLRGKDDSQITFSKELLELFYPFFKASLASKWKESVATNDGLFEIRVPLFQEALKFFKNHVHGKSISAATLEELKELSYFAGMIEDEKLKKQTSQLIFEWFADAKNAPLFDPEFMANHAPEFTEFYFAKKKIDIKKLETRGFSIGLKDFYAQFQEKDSKLLHYLANQIDQITVDAAREGFEAALHLLPKGYCRAIHYITLSNFKEAKRLQSIFPNALLTIPDSITTLRSEIRADPRNDYAHVLLGSFLADTTESEKEFHLALQLNPNNVAACTWVGSVLTRKGNLKDAEVHVRKAIELDPKKATSHRLLAELQLKNGDFDEAEKSVRTAIKFNPKYSVCYHNLGKLLSLKKNFKEAEKAFQKAVELNPKKAEWYVSLAKATADLNDAKDACYKAIELSPSDASAYEPLGVILSKKGDLGEAENAIRKMIELAPNSAKAYVHLSMILYKKGDLDGAEKEMRRALELNPKLIEVYYLDLCQILYDKDDLEGVKKICYQVIEHNPKHRGAYRQLGITARIQGSLDEAERAFQKAIELDLDNAHLHVGIGLVLQLKGRTDEAEKAYHRSLKCNEDLATAHTGLGVCYLKKGEIKKAKEEFLLALKIDPRHPFARRRLDLIIE